MWQGDLITVEGQVRKLEEVLSVYLSQGVALRHELRTVTLHGLVATQSSLDLGKYELVLGRIRAGRLNIPFIIEEHFVGERDRHYIVDGHTRVRARIDLGQRIGEAHVIWSPAGDFPSGLAVAAAIYGNVLVKDLPLD